MWCMGDCLNVPNCVVAMAQFLEAFQMSQLFENFIEQRENPAKEETTAQSMLLAVWY